MSKKTKTEISPIEQAERALADARAQLEKANQAILDSPPESVLQARDAALVCEARVRQCERDLETARATEATRDRDARLAELARLTAEADPTAARTDLEPVAVEITKMVVALSQALEWTNARVNEQRTKAEEATKIAHSLGVEPPVSPLPRGFGTLAVQGALLESGAPSISANQALVVPSTLNDYARTVARVYGVSFPGNDAPTVRDPFAAGEQAGSEGALSELRAAGVDDRALLGMIESGTLTKFYDLRRAGVRARKSAEQTRMGHIGQLWNALERDTTPAEYETQRKEEGDMSYLRSVRKRMKEIGRSGLTAPFVAEVANRVPRGFLASYIKDNGLHDLDAVFADPPKWDSRVALIELGVKLSRVEAA